jgi:hypothetical protein
VVEGMNFSNVNIGSIINALEVPPNAKRGSRV